MRTIITITESASMPGRFSCRHQTGTGRVYHSSHAGSDPSGAAAYAVDIALHTGGTYVILGPKKVLDCIPQEIRCKTQ